MKNIFLIFILMFISSQVITAKEPQSYTIFKKISLFKTNRQEIERLFKYESFKEVLQYNYPDWAFSQEQIEDAKKNPAGDYSVYYRLNDARLDITYSKGRCSENNKRGYDVEKDIVVDAYLFFFDAVKLSKLNLDSSKFTRTELNSDLIGEYSYDSEELGIHLSGVRKYVGSIQFSPTQFQEERYSCEKILGEIK